MFRVRQVVIGDRVEFQLFDRNTDRYIQTIRTTKLTTPIPAATEERRGVTRPLTESNKSHNKSNKRRCTQGINYYDDGTNVNPNKIVSSSTYGRFTTSGEAIPWLSPNKKSNHRSQLFNGPSSSSSEAHSSVATGRTNPTYDTPWDRPGYFDEPYYSDHEFSDDDDDLDEATRQEMDATVRYVISANDEDNVDPPEVEDYERVRSSEFTRLLGLTPSFMDDDDDTITLDDDDCWIPLRRISRPKCPTAVNQPRAPYLTARLTENTTPSDSPYEEDEAQSTGVKPSSASGGGRVSMRSRSDGIRTRELATLFQNVNLPICSAVIRKMTKLDLSHVPTPTGGTPYDLGLDTELDRNCSTSDPRLMQEIKRDIEEPNFSRPSAVIELTNTINLKYDCETGMSDLKPGTGPVLGKLTNSSNVKRKFHRRRMQHVYCFSTTERLRRAAFLETGLTHRMRLLGRVCRPLKVRLNLLKSCPLCKQQIGSDKEHPCPGKPTAAQRPAPGPRSMTLTGHGSQSSSSLAHPAGRIPHGATSSSSTHAAGTSKWQPTPSSSSSSSSSSASSSSSSAFSKLTAPAHPLLNGIRRPTSARMSVGKSLVDGGGQNTTADKQMSLYRVVASRRQAEGETSKNGLSTPSMSPINGSMSSNVKSNISTSNPPPPPPPLRVSAANETIIEEKGRQILCIDLD